MERILVVLPNWYGETLFATPFLRALKQQRPDTFLATLGWPKCREILLHNPHVDAMVEYDERGRHRGLAAQWALIRALRQDRYDTAFILRPSLSRSMGLRLAGIPMRIGFDTAKSGWLLTHRLPAPPACRRATADRYHAGQAGIQPLAVMAHKARSYLPLLQAVGLIPPPSITYEYVVSEPERRQAQEQLRVQGVGEDHPLVILHPGANWFHKQWAPERFAALADRLIETHHPHILVTGSPADQGLAEVVVALYGPTSPALTGPLGDPQRTIVVHHADCCPDIPCYNPESPAHLGMASISIDEVYEVACQLLQRQT